ncbi:MAG: glycosyltransferase [Ignavibacteriales bacterium]
MNTKDYTIAVINGAEATRLAGRLYIHFAYGKVIEELAGRFSKVILCVPESTRQASDQDYLLPVNVELEPLPFMVTALEGFKKGSEIVPAYRRAVSGSDFVFIRGMLTPSILALYKMCSKQNKPVVHWIVANSMQLLKSHRRDGFIKDLIGKIFVWQWEKKLLYCQKRTNAALLCNGTEIASRYPAGKKYVTVSSTLKFDEIDTSRKDTCQGSTIRILSLCFIRPEKGIEYLIEAFARIYKRYNVELILAGSRDRYPNYQKRLDDLVKTLRISDKVRWVGHVSYDMVPLYMQSSDIFAFPTLSEGTPRVLVEARAQGLPIVSTNVGGIKDSLTDGKDGLLVPPKNPVAMAEAIEILINNKPLRKEIISNGYRTVKEMTVEKFAGKITEILQHLTDKKQMALKNTAKIKI